MVDDIQTTTGNLRDLSRVTRDLGFEFAGFRKQLLDAASATDGAGKMWTNYSRILSGTALWKLQNYFRGALGFVAEHNKKLNNSIKQAQQQEEQRRRTIVDFKKINTLYQDLEANDFVYNMSRDLSAFNDEQRDAIENTIAYADALALGLSEIEAYSRGFDEITEGFKNQKDNYDSLVESMKFQENLKTKAGRREEFLKIQTAQGNIGSGQSIREDAVQFLGKINSTMNAAGEGLLKANIKMGDLASSVMFAIKEGNLGLELEKGMEKLGQTKLGIKYQKGMLAVSNKLRPILDIAMKYIIIAMFAMIALVGFMAAMQDILGEMEVLNVVTQMQEILALVAEGINALVGFVAGLINNDLDMAIGKLSELANIAFEGFLRVGALALSLGLAVIVGTIRGLPRLLFDDKYRGTVLNILGKFMVIFLTAYFVRYLAIKLMEIAAIYALPVLIGVVVGLAILAGLRKFFPKAFGERATGGLVNENVTLVGERGPELVSLPTGSRVHTANQTKNMMGGARNVFNITINARDTSDAELRRIANKIGSMVNNSVNRSTASRTLR